MTPSSPIRRGELYWVRWDPARGSEQAGTRPALVIQADAGNATPSYPDTVVLAVSTSGRADVPFHVRLVPTAENGFSSASFVKCEQILTVAKARLGQRIGSVGPDDMALVGRAVARVLAL